MPQVENSQPKASNKLPLLVGMIAILAVFGVVLTVLKMNQKPVPPPPQTSAIVTEAENLTFLQKYDQAVQIMHNQLPYAKNDQERSLIYLNIGVAYENKGDQSSALQAYLKADQYAPSYGINQAVARTAAASGNKQLAIEYYKKDIVLIQQGIQQNNNNKFHQADLPDLQAEIQQLGGTP